MTKYFNVLLIFAPVAIAGEFLGWSPTIVFWSAALAVIPLAGILGKGTEELAAHKGPKLSGFLNGTLGNAAELIITIFAIKEGLLDLVKASITGSIVFQQSAPQREYLNKLRTPQFVLLQIRCSLEREPCRAKPFSQRLS